MDVHRGAPTPGACRRRACSSSAPCGSSSPCTCCSTSQPRASTRRRARNLWDHVRALRDERGATVFLITHYLEEADALCDRILVIDRGRIVIRFGLPSPAVFAVLHATGVRLDGVEVHRPTLDDVFLNLTGRALRDEEVAA